MHCMEVCEIGYTPGMNVGDQGLMIEKGLIESKIRLLYSTPYIAFAQTLSSTKGSI